MTDAPRLYLVTPRDADPAMLVEPLEVALGTGLVACLRLDLDTRDEADWTTAVNHLMPVCHAADVPLVVTDQPDLVVRLGVDGVHLATLDLGLKKLRQSFGDERIIGASGGAGRHRAMSLAEAGADYVSLGPVSPVSPVSPVIPGGTSAEGVAGDDLFAWWAEMIETPVVAEGGVDLAAARRLRETADFLAPDPALVWADPVAALQAFAEALGD
ncbi:MAG: thiamine phosphate synthase [Pseudomonadota bacterium]